MPASRALCSVVNIQSSLKRAEHGLSHSKTIPFSRQVGLFHTVVQSMAAIKRLAPFIGDLRGPLPARIGQRRRSDLSAATGARPERDRASLE